MSAAGYNPKGHFYFNSAFFTLVKKINYLILFFEVIYFDLEQRERLMLFESMKIHTLLKIKS